MVGFGEGWTRKEVKFVDAQSGGEATGTSWNRRLRSHYLYAELVTGKAVSISARKQREEFRRAIRGVFSKKRC